MNSRSPNFLPNPRFSNCTPGRYQQQYQIRQPLYLQPNSPHMSPRGGRQSSPRNSSGSPDFIPLGISSPVNRAKQNWARKNYSNNSSYSNQTTPTSSNSSYQFSPYRRNGSRGSFRGRFSFNNSNQSGNKSAHISLYIDKEALQDPWAELEAKMRRNQLSYTSTSTSAKESGEASSEGSYKGSQENTDSTVLLESDSEESNDADDS